MTAADLGAITLNDKEIQIWRDGVLLFWGYPDRISSANLDTITVDCTGLFGYFDYRVIGGPITPLDYSTFEAGVDGWGVVSP